MVRQIYSGMTTVIGTGLCSRREKPKYDTILYNTQKWEFISQGASGRVSGQKITKRKHQKVETLAKQAF